MTTLVVTGTSTDVGKTVVTAVLAAAAIAEGHTVAVCKPVQTGVADGEPGDLAETVRLAGEVTVAECARYPDPLAPDTAARRSGLPQVRLADVVSTVRELQDSHDLVLVEGAGGVLVRLADDLTVLDVAEATDASIVVVVPAGLGALNHAELTVDAIITRGVRTAGLIIGSWPAAPDLAAACNRTDLSRVTGVPLVGAIPQGAAGLDVEEFRLRAEGWIAPDWVTGELARDNADRSSTRRS